MQLVIRGLASLSIVRIAFDVRKTRNMKRSLLENPIAKQVIKISAIQDGGYEL